MQATPIWFGPPDRPLFGWFHSPGSPAARAAVLVCPPLGHEYHEAYETLRVLAERLAGDGMCVLRMDYDGTGDSAGDFCDPGRVGAWDRSIVAGIKLLRGAVPAPVVIVGMRAGALLAALAAAGDGNVEAVVLWDPVTSGRAYVSEQRALHALSLRAPAPLSGPGQLPGRGPLVAPEVTESNVVMPGMLMTHAAAEELRKLDISRRPGHIANKVLVMSRSGRRPPELGPLAAQSELYWEEAVGQADLMEAGSAYGLVAHTALGIVASWISRMAPTQGHELQLPPQGGSAVVANSAAGAVCETPVFLGETRLFGVLSEIPGRQHGPTVVFLNAASGNHTGGNRLWAQLGRRWAADGFRCLRLDLSGLGDSPTRHEAQDRSVSRAPEAFDDIAEACRAVEPSDPSNVILVGFCTTGYQVLESALQLGPRAVIAFNPSLSFRPPETARGGSLDPRRQIALPRRAVVGSYYAARRHPPEGSAAGPGPALGRLARMVAAPRWRAALWARQAQKAAFNSVTWRAQMYLNPARRPSRWLPRLLDSGVRLFIISSEVDARALKLGVPPRTFEAYQDRGLYFHQIADHLFSVPEERSAVLDEVTSIMLQHLSPWGISAPAPCSTKV